MKNFLLSVVIFVFISMNFVMLLPQQNHAYAAVAPGAPAVPGAPVAPGAPLAPAPTVDPTIADGDWLPDADVTFQGKTASRSALLMNLVLKNYQWVNTGVNGDAPLILFWTKIRNIIYGILLLVLLAAAFAIIISGGKSLTAWMFARRFIIMVILIWFSFALCRFLYEFVDIIIGFFNKNPEGLIITSKDLFNMSFNYQDFIGLRRFGPSYNESAFVSLLLVRLTAITYYVMAGILLVRKIILWFFIAVSPIYPLLLFHFPIRNTAKIWIGEFFRWLLYAPLFFIFLSSLVVVWRHNIDLFPFDFANKTIVYPTAINILLGGPGQQLTVQNSVNYNDTFAEYVIALIMLWIVIFLPFILLRIFLDYLSNINLDKDNSMNFIQNIVKRVPGNQYVFPNTPAPVPIPPATPPGTRPAGIAKPILYGTTGNAKELPFADRMERPLGQAKTIERPATTTVQTTTHTNTQTSTNMQMKVPAFKSENVSTETAKLVSFPIPRMRDIARFETNRISSSVTKTSEATRMHETLQKIANPASITNTSERQQFTQLRDKLVQQSQKGEPLATSILSAASSVSNVNQSSTSSISSSVKQNSMSSVSSSASQTQAVSQAQSLLQKISNPESITNSTEKQQFTSIKNQLMQQSKQGDSYSSTITNLASSISNLNKQSSQQATSQVQQTLEKIANPGVIANAAERQQFTTLKQQLQEKSKAGDTVATSILSATTSLTKAKEITTQASLPQVNQVQTVNLEDYEEVKKTWLENYKKMDVPQGGGQRKQWIQNDATRLSKTIDLLSSKDQPKVEEGMKEVGSLLPFLLIGGFSQTEVVSYLQAKKHAADEALTQMKDSEVEEDSLVDTKKRSTQASMHMSATATANMVGTSGSFNSDEDDDADNPLANIVNQYAKRIDTIKSVQTPQLKSEQLSTPTMKLLNFTVPTMKDVARYESAKFTLQANAQQETTQVNQMLQKLANPDAIPNTDEKQQFIEMRKQLMDAAQKGDPLANSVMFTVNTLSQAIAMSQKNQPATTPTTMALPQTNQVQTVNLDDYEEIRRMWHDIYKNSEVPQTPDNPNKIRQNWIHLDVNKLDETIQLLKSNDQSKIADAMKQVGTLLPFLLIGGFSQTEIVAYLQAKKQAGEDVLRELTEQENEEETKIAVQSKVNATEQSHLENKAEVVPEPGKKT